VSAVPDGSYDAFVVDATALDDQRMALELTIVAGELKGEMVAVTATGLAGSDIDLLGMPATITVTDGAPHVRIDR